ncbi:activating signal cointegrator 1 complex subunit 2 isoform X2 [Arctopsyche grandis]|uniref:activating signal cointegrator 1 complex subunit 2 isoform X2 n=1 Tax=Arctopsyche grandis TaxID=121162 RepID=UPI00406D770D
MFSKSNPNNFPLENLRLTKNNVGVVQVVQALGPHWVEDRTLSLYTPAPNKGKNDLGALQTWKDSMQWLIDDLKWLLSLEYHRFWSQIVHHTPCMDMLVSFLQEAYPPYLPMHEDKSVMDLYNEAYKKVLIVFSRLITNKESADKWMENPYLGKLIYDKYIFTIPIIWDLCLTYGTTNKNHMVKLLDAIFYLQPKYYVDLGIAIAFLKQVFEFVSFKLGNNTSSTLPEVFKGFSQNFGGQKSQTSSANNELSLRTLNDFIMYILDSVVTMKLFLELHSPARKVFREKEFHISIVNFYENTITKMYEKVQLLSNNENESSNASNHLDNMRVELIDSFRFIISTTIDEILSGEKVEENVSVYLTILTDSLSEKAFVKDYNAMYPVDVDLDILCQAYTDMDPVKCDFILQAVYANYDETERRIPKVFNNTEANHLSNGVDGHSRSESPVVNPNNDIPEEAKTQSLISEVRDILPDLGDGYILKCLEHYGFNAERVINCILEGNLDESLTKLDPQLPIIPSDALDEQYLKTGIERLNVFDNDEFDVMTKDKIDLSRVHKGKRKFKHKNLSEMLNDKSYINKMKDSYAKYGLISEENEPDMYDDEYDDTYDDGARDLVSEATAELVRKPVSKSIAFKDAEESEDESEDNEGSSSNSKPADQFCENPEVLRARYQARRDIKYGQRTNVDRDVVGKAKGQGQDKDVLVNRQKKAVNKSVRGNHNRRTGAQWKRSQGVLPS